MLRAVNYNRTSVTIPAQFALCGDRNLDDSVVRVHLVNELPPFPPSICKPWYSSSSTSLGVKRHPGLHDAAVSHYPFLHDARREECIETTPTISTLGTSIATALSGATVSLS